MNILLDPYVVATPAIHSPRQKVISYIDSIIFWLDVPSLPSVNVLQPGKCIGYLIDQDRFPYLRILRGILSASGIIEYDAATLSRFAASSFHLFKCMEDYLYTGPIKGTLKIQPEIFISRLPQSVADAYCDCLGRVVLQNNRGDTTFAELYIGSNVNGTIAGGQLAIQGTITDNESIEPEMELASTPISVNTQLSVLFNREDILKSVNWDILWEYPTLAIEKAYYSAIQPGERDAYKLGGYTLGSHFIDTIRGIGLHTQVGRLKSIYMTCALVACGRASALSGIKPERLRGNTRPSDSAQGWRARISLRGAGYRLHYWKCHDGSIEFSCVNVHNDMTIYVI